MKTYAMTTNALAGVCPAIAVSSDLRAVNRIAPVFASGPEENSVLRTAGVNLSCSGHEPGGPPD